MVHRSSQTIRLNHSDNVMVARVGVSAGAEIEEEGIRCRSAIPAGHKIATPAIKRGEGLRKYGQVIGFATGDISPGKHVHTHNLEAGDFARNYAIGSESRPTNYVDEGALAHWRGDVRDVICLSPMPLISRTSPPGARTACPPCSAIPSHPLLSGA